MSGQRKRLYLHEVATRDGLQNEAAFVDTDDKIALVDALSACGYAKIEVTSFTSPKAIPALRDAEAVMHGIARAPGVVYTVLVPNVRGAARAVVRGRRSEPRDVDERKPQPREPADDARAVVRTTARRDRCGTRHRCRDQRRCRPRWAARWKAMLQQKAYSHGCSASRISACTASRCAIRRAWRFRRRCATCRHGLRTLRRAATHAALP